MCCSHSERWMAKLSFSAHRDHPLADASKSTRERTLRGRNFHYTALYLVSHCTCIRFMSHCLAHSLPGGSFELVSDFACYRFGTVGIPPVSSGNGVWCLVFCVGPLPRSFVASAFVSFAKRKSGWGICGSSGVLVPVCPCLFLFLCHSIFCTAEPLCFRRRFLIRFICLYYLQDRALERHRPNQRKKKASQEVCPRPQRPASHILPSVLFAVGVGWRMLDFRICFSPSLHWLAMQGCGLRWHIADFRSPRACRKVLGGSRVAGKVATASVARRRTVSLTGAELVTFLLMSDSRSCHIWRIDFVVLVIVSMYFDSIWRLFPTAQLCG